ncbi:MAG: YciI family protein [Nitrosospira sp.]
MLYAISGEDIPESLERRLAARTAHLDRINILQKEGRLILAGPYPAIDSPDPGPAGFSGSLIVAEFESLEAARAWAETDPYVTSGVFAKLTVKPFKKVMPP